MILSGAIQAIYGNLQLYGLFNSNHHQFRITGTFFNPGPYAGYLATIFPIVLSFLMTKIYFKTGRIHIFTNPYCPAYSKVIYYYIYLVAFFSILIILPATRSRSAWMAALASSIFALVNHKDRLDLTKILPDKIIAVYIKYKSKKFIKTLIILFIVFIINILGVILYNMKKDSADGRLLIWKVTAKMIYDKPLLGHGTGGFEANYMNYQAEYFTKNKETEYVILADNNKYAFNIILRLLTEYGLVGLLVVVLLVYKIFFGKIINEDSRFTLKVAKASLLSIIVFGMFSYPDKILPLNINMIILLGIASNNLKPINNYYRKSPGFILEIIGSKLSYKFIKLLFILILLANIYILGNKGVKLHKGYKNWASAYTLYSARAYEHCIDDYKKAYEVFKRNGDFLLNYGKALSLAEEHNKAVEVLQEAIMYYPNTVAFTALGDSYKALKKYDNSKNAYKMAVNMIPHRFYAQYLLAKLYYDTGKIEQANIVANKVLNRKAKVPSSAIDEIKAEMRELVESLKECIK